MPLTISDHYDPDSKSVIQYIFDEYKRIFNSEELQKDILVKKREQDYPQTAPKRQNLGQKEDYIIYLTAESSYWCHIIYQLAHEMSHLVMKCYPDNKNTNFKWISECLCAAASDYMMELSKKYFEEYSPSYVKSVQDYLQNHINKSSLPKDTTINQYIQEHLQDLEEDPTDEGKTERTRNNVIAVYLFKMIQENEAGWKAVELFEQLSSMNLKGSDDFITHWKNICRNDSEKDFVKSFYEIFKGNL